MSKLKKKLFVPELSTTSHRLLQPMEPAQVWPRDQHGEADEGKWWYLSGISFLSDLFINKIMTYTASLHRVHNKLEIRGELTVSSSVNLVLSITPSFSFLKVTKISSESLVRSTNQKHSVYWKQKINQSTSLVETNPSRKPQRHHKGWSVRNRRTTERR